MTHYHDGTLFYFIKCNAIIYDALIPAIDYLKGRLWSDSWLLEEDLLFWF